MISAGTVLKSRYKAIRLLKVGGMDLSMKA